MAARKNNSLSFDALSGLAQELNAPLQSLVKSSQKLLDEYKSRNFEYLAYKDFKNIITTLEQMQRQLKRCAITTERIINLGPRPSDSSPQICQPNEVVRDIVHLLAQQIGSARIKVVTSLQENLPPVKIGKVECHQVIYNVLINAVQAMPAGGIIRIRTKFNKTQNAVAIEIEDEGVGITPEHLSKVFEPFFTTKERGVEKNAGLGLSIVYSLLHSFGGDIYIQSSLRRGTKVHIDLPATA